LVHAVHEDHWLITQSTAHGAALQVRVSAECGHALPPNVGSTVARLRCCEPAPHDLVQTDQVEMALTLQSAGQVKSLHERVLASYGQALPPPTGFVRRRERVCMPPPQVTEHTEKLPHGATTQSTGHACLLQLRDSAACGHALPPLTGDVVERARFDVPVPHDLEQADQAENEPTTQSTAHGAALQARVSAECGHALPPNVGSTLTRLRFCEPTPHDFVQVDQESKSATTQSREQTCALHVRVSARYGHT
jgi:hypothetical protein